ncbi:uncharacterized protein BP5553_01928 [Venustampulla echinocandica]|uniref:Uncharacterized protein n=1 Tax=Venustampulla echinocandica TaxID=2656787 RepID=A0A370U2E3_9HELO|nr:uncharacterized protein BP5553_01928 [Venustampulla echinocandica]RDL41949.1 hypothetical protein BP5553_01928 [Venustampulla echinocandica]
MSLECNFQCHLPARGCSSLLVMGAEEHDDAPSFTRERRTHHIELTVEWISVTEAKHPRAPADPLETFPSTIKPSHNPHVHAPPAVRYDSQGAIYPHCTT